jgi:hypothetical protein
MEGDEAGVGEFVCPLPLPLRVCVEYGAVGGVVGKIGEPGPWTGVRQGPYDRLVMVEI